MKKYYLLLLFVTSFMSAQIVNIPDANFKAKLIALGLDTNQDGEIQNSEAAAVTDFLNISNSNISNLEGIQYFVNVVQIYCNNNQLTSLNLNNLNNLGSISLNNNQLTSLSLSSLSSLYELKCDNNLLTTIDVSSLPMLGIFDCGGNLLTTLDVSDNPNMCLLDCDNNPQLTSIFMKNGPPVCGETYGLNNNPNLEYVCTDEQEVLQLINYFGNNGMNVNVNSYCSFTPGGTYNTITGNIRFDADNNGCDTNDAAFDNIKINLSNNTDSFSTFTDSQGNYKFYTLSGDFILTPSIENTSYFNFSPINTPVVFPLADNSTTTQNFCITPNGIHPDLEVVIVPIIPARPGFDAVYKIVYKNKGNQTVQGFVNFTFNDAVLDYVSASVVPNGVSGGSMNWIVSNIAPFQSGSILVTLNVNSPQEVPAVNIDDVLVFNAFIDVSTDEMWDDNNFDFNQTVVGSYDPNDITCLEGNALPTIEMGKYLHYNIRFENTGTAPAENIVVKNEIDLAQYNIQSLQIMESSHPVEIRVTGNIAEFIFQSIDLDTGGHGNILLKLKSNLSLSGNQVMNSADIFFDYNFPIVTNDEETVFADLSNNDFTKDLSIQVYPNPTNDIINVKAESTINSIQLYDVQGRLLNTKLLNENASTIDLSSYNVGIYIITIHTDQGIKTEKIIRK